MLFSRRSPLVLLAVALFALCAPGALAVSDYDQGVRLFNRQQYAEASAYFDRAVVSNSDDSNALYYSALAHHYMKDLPGAMQRYRQIVRRFPATQAAGLAATALKSLTPRAGGSRAAVQSGSPAAGLDGDDSLSSLPDQATVYYHAVGESIVVPAQINNRDVAMVFDTGAEMTVFGKNTLASLGLSAPTGNPDGYSGGVGGQGQMATWLMRADLKVGNILRPRFSIYVLENLDTPLLGQTFFKDFEYTIDSGSKCIRFSKRARSSGGGDSNTVAFVREGNEMVVPATVNGRATKMIFDTGAEGTVVLTANQARDLGLTVPDDAKVMASQGVSGMTRTLQFNVDRVTLGPIDRFDIPVYVVDEAIMPHPLVGHAFYSDWQYTIDNDRNLIRFLRR